MLSQSQIQQFKETGFLMVDKLFNEFEISAINKEVSRISHLDSPKRILEKNGNMRSFFAPHEESVLLDKVCRHRSLVDRATQLLEDDVYLYQVKVNSKQALVGDWWEWHQDYPYWHHEDGMIGHNVLTMMIFLNDVNEFNGPMLLIPGSNKAGLVDDIANDSQNTDDNEWFQNYQTSTTYMSNLTADLKYTLKQKTLLKWMNDKGVYSAKGPAGAVLIFDGLVFHASSNNLSPWDRNTLLVTFNGVQNKLQPMENTRPSFLANRNAQPVFRFEGNLLNA